MESRKLLHDKLEDNILILEPALNRTSKGQILHVLLLYKAMTCNWMNVCVDVDPKHLGGWGIYPVGMLKGSRGEPKTLIWVREEGMRAGLINYSGGQNHT